jgi:hypothetical protein
MTLKSPGIPAVILLSAVLVAGFSAATVPAAAASRSHLSSQQKALAEYRACKTLKVFYPPAGFKPLKATARQLRNAGYPARPPQSDPAALRMWKHLVNRPLHFEAPHPVCTTEHHLGLSSDSVITSPRWAGHVVPESDYGVPIVQTGSAWVQPAVEPNATYPNFKTAPTASFWTGTGLSDILQAGCDSISASTAQYRCWTEDFPDTTIDYEGPVVSPGNTIYVSDNYVGNNEVDYYFENETTGITESYMNAAPYVGLGSADYVNEVAGPYLPNFGAATVSSNSFVLENGTIDTLGENNIYQMVDSKGNVMSSPSFLTGDTFQQIFYYST